MIMNQQIITLLLTAAMRSTSLRLLRMKQASASSILSQRSKQQQQQQRYGQQVHNISCMETRYNIEQMRMDRWTVLECTVYALWLCARIALALTGECKNAK